MARLVTCPHCGGTVKVYDQPSLFDAPTPIQPEHAKARRTDPDTSQAAARYPRGDSQRWRILHAHHQVTRGMTDEELHRLPACG
jgi:hypothetical protein